MGNDISRRNDSDSFTRAVDDAIRSATPSTLGESPVRSVGSLIDTAIRSSTASSTDADFDILFQTLGLSGPDTPAPSQQAQAQQDHVASPPPPTDTVNLQQPLLQTEERLNGVTPPLLPLNPVAAASASREAAEKSLAAAFESRQEMDRKLADTVKEMELLRDKLVSAELAQEEGSNLSDVVHADNVKLEHDVAFLKAVLDDTQKELNSTRGVLAAERARAFQLQVEVFHLKQRLQSMETRAPTPRKPFQV